MSWAKPTSAPRARTASPSAPRFSATGSAGRGKRPSAVVWIAVTSAPSASTRRGAASEAAPPPGSTTTRRRRPAGSAPTPSTTARTWRSTASATRSGVRWSTPFALA